MTPQRDHSTGWAAFRMLRRTPTPMPERRHGNTKHGRYTAEAVARRRRARALWRWILAGGLGEPPPPPRISRWGVYRLHRHRAQAAVQRPLEAG